MSESAVLLHGFGGTHRTWDGVCELLDRERYTPLALDLPGHGAAAGAPQPITLAGCVAHVLERAPASFALCGYSLGARVALHVALAAHERVRGLVIVSGTAGIEDERERRERRASDARLAAELETAPFERFMERWHAQPLFAADPHEVGELARADQRRNEDNPGALAAALRGLGAGVMEPLWQRLGELAMPVAVLAGDRDERYVAIARRMAALLPRAQLQIVPGGHRLALENPRAVAAALEALDAEAGAVGQVQHPVPRD